MIRPIRPEDVPVAVELVHELADYEREPASCLLTTEQLTEALFRDNPALFGLVAVDDEDQVVGTALWFLNFSTWRGVHGVYLEDLYVRPAARRGGHGKALLRELARIAAERGYARLDWAVLDWNAPAQAFYRSIGAAPNDEWTGWRVEGQALAALAEADRVTS